MGKCGKARQATYDNIIQCTHFARWITKARIQTHMEHLILTAFPVYVTLTVMLNIYSVHLFVLHQILMVVQIC